MLLFSKVQEEKTSRTTALRGDKKQPKFMRCSIDPIIMRTRRCAHAMDFSLFRHSHNRIVRYSIVSYLMLHQSPVRAFLPVVEPFFLPLLVIFSYVQGARSNDTALYGVSVKS
jgi:hypothetical protein